MLLVDTQGMFDMETAQMLTAAIFGLSTLISSYLVYNVEKRIQVGLRGAGGRPGGQGGQQAPTAPLWGTAAEALA